MEIGDRMKTYYEKPYNIQLPHRLPVIIRVDGKSFHSFTRGMQRPFDNRLMENMGYVAIKLCQKTHTAQFAYIQSDEISILLHPYKKLDTQAYFANEVQKIASVTAGIASSVMSREYEAEVVFDARVFVLPEDEVCNYFIWRQQDAVRNSISMVAQSKFSAKQLHKKNSNQMQEMMFQKDGTNWNDLQAQYKRGFCVVRNPSGFWGLDYNIPNFTKDRNYVEKYLEIEED